MKKYQLSFLVIMIFCCTVFFINCSSDSGDGPGFELEASRLETIVGVDLDGNVINQPSNWPEDAGIWNGKGADYNPATDKLSFETFREDILGGHFLTTPGGATPPGVTQYFQAGPILPGMTDLRGTTVVYISDADGKNAVCIGCSDIVDGQDGVQIFSVLPSISSTPNAAVRKTGATIYANQNKDLARWLPDGEWMLLHVEFPKHGLNHEKANGEIAFFNDIWAVSKDEKIWVQLTDFASTWTHYDSASMFPYGSKDLTNCVTGTQYSGTIEAPYDSYTCSNIGEPPPSNGAMRVIVGNNSSGPNNLTPVMWAEKIGIDPAFTTGGPQQLATANFVISSGLPALINYKRNIAPTPNNLSGENTWNNSGGTRVIGTAYEVWDFSPDDSKVTFASDAFFSSMESGIVYGPFSGSFAFTDVAVWSWVDRSRLSNVTAFDEVIYNYPPNGATVGDVSKFGQWEEPAIFVQMPDGDNYICFASSASMNPAWNPMNHSDTMGLDVWIVKEDRSSPAEKITSLNTSETKKLVYPTAIKQDTFEVFLTDAPGGYPGGNPPGSLRVLRLDVQE